MQTCGANEWYLLPRDCSLLSLHPILAADEGIQRAKKVLKSRHHRRIIIVQLSKEQADNYFDKMGNPTFMDRSLEMVEELPKRFDDEVEDIMKTKSVEQTPTTKEETIKPLQTILKDVILPKFNGKSHNARNWLRRFESECIRINIPKNRYHEALRLFLEGPAENWYSATQITSMSNEWEFWKDSFEQVFEKKGWSDMVYAYSYSYISGPVADYALKKLNLIVEVDALTSDNVKLNMIVHGLPAWARDKLDRTEIDTVGKLLQKLNQFETHNSNNNKRSGNNNNNNKNSNNKWTTFATEPCGYCLKKGFRRIHLESNCRVKKLDENRKERNNNNPNNKFEKKDDRPFRLNTMDVMNQVIQNEEKNE